MQRRQNRAEELSRGPVIQLFGGEYLPRIEALVAGCPDAPAWPAEAWKSFLGVQEANGTLARALFATTAADGSLIGVMAVTQVQRATELELLLVHPGCRRRGIGRQMSQHWLAWAAGEHASEALLEVRASNSGAQALYGELGFVVEGVRRTYYRHPEEDALLMRRSLLPEGQRAG